MDELPLSHSRADDHKPAIQRNRLAATRTRMELRRDPFPPVPE
jgi:hypothetical protein